MQGVRGSSPRSSTNRDETAEASPLAGAAGGAPSPRTDVTDTTETTDSTATPGSTERADPGRALRPERDRAALAGALGRARAARHGPRRRPATEVLPADDVPVSVGRPAHRSLVHRHADRRDRALPADARLERLLPDRLRRVRPAGRERRDQERLSTRANGRCATSRTCAASSGRWARRSTGRPRSSPATRLLPLEPVAVPALPRGRPGLPREVAGRLVPQRRDARARAGRGRRPPLLALRREGREARPRPVVPARDEVRRRAARLRRHRLARSRSGSCRRTGSAGPRAARSSSTTAPSDHHAGRRASCASSRPGPTRCSGRRSWSSPRSIRSSPR